MTKQQQDNKAFKAFLQSEQGIQFIGAVSELSKGVQGLANFLESQLQAGGGVAGAGLVLPPTPAVVEKAADGKRKRGSAKAKKDPLAPKHPSSSFLLFCQDTRPAIRESKPELNPKEVASELGRIWREMSEEEKEEYVSEANTLRQAYKEEVAAYKQKDESVELPPGEDSDDDDDEEEDSDEVEAVTAPPPVIAVQQQKKVKTSHVAPPPPPSVVVAEEGSDDEDEDDTSSSGNEDSDELEESEILVPAPAPPVVVSHKVVNKPAPASVKLAKATKSAQPLPPTVVSKGTPKPSSSSPVKNGSSHKVVVPASPVKNGSSHKVVVPASPVKGSQSKKSQLPSAAPTSSVPTKSKKQLHHEPKMSPAMAAKLVADHSSAKPPVATSSKKNKEKSSSSKK